MKLLEPYKDFDDAINSCECTSQLEALLYLLRGDNVFLSGPAGSGKSYVIQKYVELLKEKGKDLKIYKTSTTGISAVNINGITIHKYAGFGASKLSYEEAKKQKANFYQSDRMIKDTDILIIDEISMLSERKLNFLVERLKSVLGKKFLDKIQIIVSGDFSQLPPVNTSKAKEDIEDSNFCFGTKSWEELNFKNLYLDKSFRTKDLKFSKFLDNITFGLGYNEENLEIIKEIPKVEKEFIDGSMLLLSTNADVDTINSERQALNPNEKRYFDLKYNIIHHDYSKEFYNVMRKDFSEDTLLLKSGDTVMITMNENDNFDLFKDFNAPPLVNGTIGTISFGNIGYNETINFKTKEGYLYCFKSPVTKIVKHSFWENGKQKEIEIGSYTQYPLKLAYAMTIHKSQGQTFSNITIDLTKCWMEGLGYVSLSRATSLDGINLITTDGWKTYNNKSFLINKESIEIKKQIIEDSKELRKKEKDNLLKLFNEEKEFFDNKNENINEGIENKSKENNKIELDNSSIDDEFLNKFKAVNTKEELNKLIIEYLSYITKTQF